MFLGMVTKVETTLPERTAKFPTGLSNPCETSPAECLRNISDFCSPNFHSQILGAVDWRRRPAELATIEEYIKQFLEMYLLKLLNSRFRPPSDSRGGSRGYVQNLFTLQKEFPLDWITAFAESSQQDNEAGLKVNISSIPFLRM